MHLMVKGVSVGEGYAFNTPGPASSSIQGLPHTPFQLISHHSLLRFPGLCLSQVTVVLSQGAG